MNNTEKQTANQKTMDDKKEGIRAEGSGAKLDPEDRGRKKEEQLPSDQVNGANKHVVTAQDPAMLFTDDPPGLVENSLTNEKDFEDSSQRNLNKPKK